MPDVLRDTSQASMVHAIEANLFAFYRAMALWTAVEVHDDADAVWTRSSLPFPLFNSVVFPRFADHVDERIESRLAPCRDRGLPMLWWTGPSARPADLGRRLEVLGLFPEPARGMALDLRRARPAAGPAGVVVDPVTSPGDLDEWRAVVCAAFGVVDELGDALAGLARAVGLEAASPLRHFLARERGHALAACSLFVGGGVAGLYVVSTRPEARRRGLGSVVVGAALAEAQRLGYRLAVLHASPLGEGVYRRLGFQDCCPIGQYVWVPA